MIPVEPARIGGMTVHGPDGKAMGRVVSVYVDRDSAAPVWAAVRLDSPWARDVRMVPLTTAELKEEDHLLVPYTLDKVKDSPYHDPEEDLGEEKAHSLTMFYRLDEKEEIRVERAKKRAKKELGLRYLEEKVKDLEAEEEQLRELDEKAEKHRSEERAQLEEKERSLEQKEQELAEKERALDERRRRLGGR